MSDKVDVKFHLKPNINIDDKTIKSKQKKNYNSLTPNKYQKPKEGILYNDKTNISNHKALAPHHNNYNINNNISININIDLSNNKAKQIEAIKNKSSVKNQPIRIKKDEFKNSNSLIFNTLKYYTNKNNLQKSPSNLRIKSENIGLKELKYNKNKSNKNADAKKRFNLTTSAIKTKKQEKNNKNKMTIGPKNISKEKVTKNDNNISKNKENKKKFTISITTNNLNNENKLIKNKSNQEKNKFQKNIPNKIGNYSPKINRAILNHKQNIILNYTLENKTNNYFHYKDLINNNKNKTFYYKNKGSSPFSKDKGDNLKKKNNSKDNSLNLVNLLSKNQIINNNKTQSMKNKQTKQKSPLNRNKIEIKNSKLNNNDKILRYSYKKDNNNKNLSVDNKNLNLENKSKNNCGKNELVGGKKENFKTNKSPSKKNNNLNLKKNENENKIKEEEKIKKVVKKAENIKEEGKMNKKEEESKKEEEEKQKQKKIKEEKQKLIEEQKKKEEEIEKRIKEENKDKNKDKGKEMQKKENNKKRILNQSKSQNEISSDFIKKQFDDKKNEEQNKNLIPSEPAIKKILKMESICKKGYAGPDIKKENQDNLFIYKNFLDSPDIIFLGVCDGHGMFGQDISGYIVNNLPKNLNSSFLKENLKSISSEKDYEQIKNIISLTFVQTNINLVNDDKINSTLSGTTCSSLIFCPEKIITANVGDSRCVLGKFDGKKWKAKNITRDQKPTDEEEKKRIIEKGGRIEAFKDEEGDFVGPVRVWLKGENIPGLAMARSFGDDIAHSVGVVSQPEIFEFKLLNEDKFILLASDGIWEFISSDECVNIVKDYYLKDDIEGALDYLYKESTKRWTMEEEVIDDITLIIIFLN